MSAFLSQSTLITNLLRLIRIFSRDGCRPYIEVYSESRCVLSTLQDYEKMRLYHVAEGKVSANLNQHFLKFFNK